MEWLIQYLRRNQLLWAVKCVYNTFDDQNHLKKSQPHLVVAVKTVCLTGHIYSTQSIQL